MSPGLKSTLGKVIQYCIITVVCDIITAMCDIK